MFTKLKKQQKGFTLIEVLVVVGILAILLAITLIALNPGRHFADTRNTQRSSDVSAILNAIYEYQAQNNGSLPAAVQGLVVGTVYSVTNDTTVANRVNLCSALVPGIIADLPLDPNGTLGYKRDGSNNPFSGAACSATTYNTGYTLTVNSENRMTVNAPGAENSASISVTR